MHIHEISVGIRGEIQMNRPKNIQRRSDKILRFTMHRHISGLIQIVSRRSCLKESQSE